jgi:hypothetical protein
MQVICCLHHSNQSLYDFEALMRLTYKTETTVISNFQFVLKTKIQICKYWEYRAPLYAEKASKFHLFNHMNIRPRWLQLSVPLRAIKCISCYVHLETNTEHETKGICAITMCIDSINRASRSRET